MSVDLSRFHEVFFDEAAEHLENMEQLLLGLDVSAPDADDLNAIFRAAHSIKGGAGTFGFDDLTEVTHVLETLLDRIRNNELAMRSEMVDVFLEAGDVLRARLTGHREGLEVDPSDASSVMERLNALAIAPAQDEDDGGFGFFDDAPGSEKLKTEDLGYGFFDEVPQLPLPHPGPGLALHSSPASAAGSDASRNPAFASKRGGERRESLRDSNKTDSSIRVSIEKVDQMINLVGELVITQAMLAQTAAQLDPVLNERLMNGMAQLERNTRDLQESVMSIRMMPMSSVFSRFPRVVRDLAGKLDKEIDLVTEGESTELDKGLIEKIVDPLTHLVRNSLDHGIETPDRREAAGKGRKGKLTLRAAHKGGSIVIEVQDDGAGLDRKKLLAKAAERGMPVSDAMSDQEVWQLIFAPGFSTAEKITDVSGRGVGMDVVKRNIDALGGRIEIFSEPDCGTRVSIQLPLTLAILDGMSVAVGAETFIVPLTYISESLQPSAEAIRTISGQGQVVNVRGEYLPLILVHRLFNLAPRHGEPTLGILVIVETGAGRVALFVDELLGQHQVVIKSLEANYHKVPGIAGATIMGDGRVALILDIAGMARLAHHEL